MVWPPDKLMNSIFYTHRAQYLEHGASNWGTRVGTTAGATRWLPKERGDSIFRTCSHASPPTSWPQQADWPLLQVVLSLKSKRLRCGYRATRVLEGMLAATSISDCGTPLLLRAAATRPARHEMNEDTDSGEGPGGRGSKGLHLASEGCISHHYTCTSHE
jgi:hypothetical protein